MSMLNDRDGLAGKLLTDQTLYDQLNKLTADLGSVLTDVRRDPKRYTKGLICVLNCK
jgi:phospholipid/cholesterol/gamma-HCH transport system substrate-binding protein